MATILMVNELGGNLGHVTRLLPLAQAFAEQGHEPVFVVPDIVTANSVLRETGYRVFQAPMWRPIPARTGQRVPGARSFADILAIHGYADPAGLLAMVEAWQRLIDVTQAGLVICDHSPTLCLAAYGEVPAVVGFDGFTVPPADVEEYPVLRKNMPELNSHEELLESVKKVQKARGRPAPDTLPGIYGKAMRLICALPELDPYIGLRAEPVLGPMKPLPRPAALPRQPRFFVYLNATYKGLDRFLSSIARTGVKGAVYLSGASKGLNDKLRQHGLDAYDKPAPFSEVLPSSSVVIHHGGLGTSEAAIAYGRPQILLPRHLEQQLSARAMVRLGIAGAVTQRTLKEGGGVLVKLLKERGFGRRAQALALQVAQRGYEKNMSKVAKECLALLS